MAILERLLVALAQRHHRGHVDLVEGREHRRGALRLDEPPGDRGAALRHAHALFGAIAGAARRHFGDRRAGLALRRLCGGRCCARSAPLAVPVAACSTSRRMTRPASPLPRTRLEIHVVLLGRLRAVGVDRVFLGAGLTQPSPPRSAGCGGCRGVGVRRGRRRGARPPPLLR